MAMDLSQSWIFLEQRNISLWRQKCCRSAGNWI